MNYIAQIISYVRKAQEIAAQHGFKNLLQPGLVKELVVADILGHEVHRTKHEPDAYDPANPKRKFEYLSCFDGGTFQLDRMFKSPADKRAKSLERITRNSAIYCAVFDKESPLNVITIYEVPVDVLLREAERQLNASRNDISHVGVTIKWAQQNGKVVYTIQA
ncbi:MAG TPA: hypothetical protein PLT00_15880 [Verrucomicrobiota bacterium]|nr:hypothetical protein [Verrucomicrobiota bacterium]HPY32062.1 hypothetical protein [Verrucomicrobiota bacterium]HQB18173.1 hypothetical protein [Verrucomicrobiota bacterium]